MRKSDLLTELTDVMSDGVAQDLWLLSIGIDNNPWDQYQPLIPRDECNGFIVDGGHKMGVAYSIHSEVDIITRIRKAQAAFSTLNKIWHSP